MGIELVSVRAATPIEQRIEAALLTLGYPGPRSGMSMLEAMELVARALEGEAAKREGQAAVEERLASVD